jgi:hypothetical protein
MKKTVMILAVAVLVVTVFSSCNRYVSEGPKGTCGVWYPKKCKIGTKNW